MELPDSLPGWLRDVQWSNENTALIPERTIEKKPKGHIQMRAAHNFSFVKDNRTVLLRPNMIKAELKGIELRANVALLNEVARYNVQAGEWKVPWPTMQCIPMIITNILAVGFDQDPRYRANRPTLCVWTKKFIYYLLGPSTYYTAKWNKNLTVFVEPGKLVKDLLYRDIDLNERPAYWRGLASWKFTRLHTHKRDKGGKQHVDPEHPTAEHPREDDQTDDLEDQGENPGEGVGPDLGDELPKAQKGMGRVKQGSRGERKSVEGMGTTGTSNIAEKRKAGLITKLQQ
ncbi:hypothetical protein FS749_002920 [Ceratobasidium sp. UAMH 11750]|nr:hypothetical protein FS749_002920 [Ceratobasidium sp. UAMH 11750]